ncbi:hypothetical protein [uncultured Oceanisphaera sp.]|uniref:hypothetical protein n=1 Tax=uncultured Oceanisphaera sp. TaxID=353858 RepID=UPI00260DAADE|nr:hypothetical protein [uncultured Oceanisphaera sp.]
MSEVILGMMSNIKGTSRVWFVSEAVEYGGDKEGKAGKKKGKPIGLPVMKNTS